MHIQHIFKQIDAHRTIYYAWFEAMHTRIDLALCHLSEKKSLALTDKLCKEIERIEKIGNRFDSNSEISSINQLAHDNPLKISDEIYSIIADCIEFNKKTSGIFDITIQSGNNHRNGINNIILNPDEKTIYFSNKDVLLDLCGYLKGYALDKIKTILIIEGCTDALVNMGNSSVLALGDHPNGDGWKISTSISEHKETTAKEYLLHNEFLTSSGNFTKSQKHIINPKTGEFVEGTGICSVVTNSGVEGEVFSTVLFISKTVTHN